MSNDKTKLILANTNEQGTDALNIQSLINVFRDKQRVAAGFPVACRLVYNMRSNTRCVLLCAQKRR